MPRNRRPTVILVMAILNMVMGAFTLLCGLCAAGANSFVAAMGANQQGPAGAGVAEMTTFMDKEVPGWQAVEIGRGLLLILLGVLVIVAGIGLLKMQSWARWLSVFYAAVLIPLTIGHLAFELALVNPAMEKWETQQEKKGVPAPPPSFKAGQQFGKSFGAVAFGSIPILYCIALGIVMLLPSVGQAFAPPRRRRARGDEEDDFDDEDDDRSDRPKRRRDFDDRDDDDDNRFRRRPRGRDYDDDD